MAQQPANILELMKSLLTSMDITDYEPAVPHMLVELFYRHVSDVLKKAKELAISRNRPTEIDEEDIKLAIMMIVEQSIKQQTHLDAMQRIADNVNKNKMPPIPDVPEIILPPEETTLLEPNWQVGPQNRA